MENQKTWQKETPIGKVTITGTFNLDYKHIPIKIEVSGVDGITHNYPHASKVNQKGDLLLRNCKFKNKPINGIGNLKGILEWYTEAREKVEVRKEELKKEEIENAKKESMVEFTVHTSYGFGTANAYISHLLDGKFNDYEKASLIVAKLGIENYDVDMGDYSITCYYRADANALANAIKEIKAEMLEAKNAEEAKNKAKEIADLKERISNKNVPYQNLYVVDKCLSTGLSHYTFIERVSKDDFNRARKYFDFVDTTRGGSDYFDPMYGTKFKGYTTTNPNAVMDILYPNWVENGLVKLKERLEQLEK